jgi:hypothetical protein
VARRYRYSGANWDSSKHPRDGNGRFTARLKPKLTQSIRVSPSSVSYNGGVRLQVVPGRANLYVGGLVRVERVNGGNLFKRHTDAAVNSVARRFGDEGGRSNLAQVLKGNQINVKGVGAQASLRRGNPTFRLSRTPTTRAADQVRVRRRSVRPPRPNRSRTPNLTSNSIPSLTSGAIVRGRKPRKRRASRTR